MSSITTTTSSSTTGIRKFTKGVQYGFYFDQSRCIGCSTCSLACKEWNDIDPGAVRWLRVLEWETGTFPTQRIAHLFLPCFHCSNPVCVQAVIKAGAPGALIKEGDYGAVLIDPAQANNSAIRSAYTACPYGAISFDSDATNATASKCTMCIDRLTQGLMPVCVESCPQRALDFDTMTSLQSKYGKNNNLGSMPDPSIASPSAVFKQAPATKTNVVPYDVPTALQLLGQRGTLPSLYTNSSAVTDTSGVARNAPVLKPTSSKQVISTSLTDDA